MNGGSASFALREMRRMFGSRRVQVALVGVSLILGVAGPFNTLALMSVLPRIAYWAFIVFATFAIGCFFSALIERLLQKKPRILRHALAGCAIGIGVTLLLYFFNAAIYGFGYADLADVLETLVTVTFIALVIEVGMSYAHAPDATESPTPPAILQRLPIEKRGALVSLSATDHYVNIVTTTGSALVLIRLADAIAEAGANGLQVHRSHWVAVDQVRAARRERDRAVLTMSDGTEIPASRSYLPAVRAAGLLEK